MTIKQHRVATSYGWVRIIGESRPLVRAVLQECGDGVTLARAAGASAEKMIERAERMNQNKEKN